MAAGRMWPAILLLGMALAACRAPRGVDLAELVLEAPYPPGVVATSFEDGPDYLAANPVVSEVDRVIRSLTDDLARGILGFERIDEVLFASYTGRAEFGVWAMRFETVETALEAEASMRSFGFGSGRTILLMNGTVLALLWNDGVEETVFEPLKLRVENGMGVASVHAP